jgi:hypothetical protein
MSTALTLVDAQRAPAPMMPSGASVFDDVTAFRLATKGAEMLAASTIVPKEYQGNEGNCFLAISVARRMSADPLMVMQNPHIIHGRPSWSSSWVIAAINSSGRFGTLRFRFTGQGDARACVAYAKSLLDGELVEGTAVTVAMAKAQGWWSRSGSKWPDMTDQMMSYRAAAFFGRLHAPDILLGMHTVDEVEDIQGTAIAERWQPTGAPVAVQGAVPAVAALPAAPVVEQDPQREEYERLLAAHPWNASQRAQLDGRWATADMAERNKILTGMRRAIDGPRPAPAPVAEAASEEQQKLAAKLLASRVWSAEEKEGWLRVMGTASKAQATGHIDAIKAELERRKAARKAAAATQDEEAPLTLDTAMALVLPGAEQDFEGHGGKALKTVSPGVLQKIARWIDANEDRKAEHERLRGAIHLVLEQWKKETAAEPEPAPAAPQPDALFSPDDDGLPF